MAEALVLTAAGINCDLELARAFELAGANATAVHVNELIADPSMLRSFDLIGVPGGFSFGDAIAAGRVLATLMRKHLYSAFVEAIERRTPIFAPCNGFQILCQMGLLPGPLEADASWPATPPTATVALAPNARGRFVDTWSRVTFPQSHCIWTRDLHGDPETLMLPSAHGEGRFIVDDAALLDRLHANGQVAVRYADTDRDNFNGSMNAIAGICDRSGYVFGLMPHPERYARWEQHPFWTRLTGDQTEGEPIGLQMFRNAVATVHAQGDVGVRQKSATTQTV